MPSLLACGSAFFSALGRLTGVIRRLMARVAHRLRTRRDLEILASLDDRMLRDVGLTRSDLRAALAGPFWRDPGLALTGPAQQRGTHQSRRIGSVPSIVPAQVGRPARRGVACSAREPRPAA